MLPAAGLLAGARLLIAQTSYMPIHFRQVSGIRPFVGVQMNGKPFEMMVHANASFYVMTTHANATAAGLKDLQKSSDFGISSPGHVDTLGRAETTLEKLRVGESEASEVPLSVFEVPVPDMQGMLGIRWLRDKRVIVDYEGYRLGFPAALDDGRTEDQRFLDRGYIAHKMTWDATSGGYYVTATVDGKPARLQVSTVSNNILDSHFAQEAGIPFGPVIGEAGGPKGAQTDVFLAKRQVTIVIDEQATAPTQPEILDIDAYDSAKPADKQVPVSGTLGAEFMLANQAIIDFGTETLLVAPR